jgi:hypothetical protein
MANFNLTREQCEKGDMLLKELCEHQKVDSQYAYNLFQSNEIAIAICTFLKNNNLIKVHAAELDPILIMLPTEVTCIFINSQGGLKKIYEDQKLNKEREAKSDEILDLDLKLKRFESKIGKRILIYGFIITVINLILSVLVQVLWSSGN